MKSIIVSLAFLSLSNQIVAQKTGIAFENNLEWGALKAKAKRENKFIFMDVYATWCGPCKQMDNVVYPTENVGLFMNDKFVSVKVQANRTNEDSAFIKKWYGDTQRILELYKPGGFPAYLYFSPDGRLISKAEGLKSAEEFLQSASAAIDSSLHYTDQLRQFYQHRMPYSKMPDFARKAKLLARMDIAQRVADAYINAYLFTLDKRELLSQEHLGFIGEFLGDEHSKAFSYFLRDSNQVNAVLGKYVAQAKIMACIDRNYLPQGNITEVKKEDWDTLEKTVAGKFGTLGQELIDGKRMCYDWALKDWQSFGQYYIRYFKRAMNHPAYDNNTFAWSVFEHVDDPKVVSFACEVMKHAIEAWDRSPEALDTYANLLFKADQIDKAIEWEERALRMKKGAPDEKLYRETLERMKKTQPNSNPSNKK